MFRTVADPVEKQESMSVSALPAYLPVEEIRLTRNGREETRTKDKN